MAANNSRVILYHVSNAIGIEELLTSGVRTIIEKDSNVLPTVSDHTLDQSPPPHTVMYSKTLACIKILWRVCPKTLTVPYLQSFYFSRSRIDSKTGILKKFQVMLSLLVQGSYFVYRWLQR